MHGMLPEARVDLYWLPLGAGAPSGSRSVRINGIVFEAIQSAVEHRKPRGLYHAGLEVRLGSELFVIEVAPSPDGVGVRRGVVAEGPVGTRFAGRARLFRYEVRCWAGGAIPDIDQAVASPIRLGDDPCAARRLLELVPSVPTRVWGRDDAGVGEMWTSNSVVSWLIVCSGLPADRVHLPPNGRAPGWDAGLVSARASLSADVRSAARQCNGPRLQGRLSQLDQGGDDVPVRGGRDCGFPAASSARSPMFESAWATTLTRWPGTESNAS